MPTSGIKTDPNCVTEFNAMKLKKKDIRYIIYAMNEAKEHEIEVNEVGDGSKTYDDFVKALPEDDCRYAVVNLEFTLEDGGKREKIVFVSWAPSKSKQKPRMLYATTKDDFKKQLVGAAIELQANGPEDITYEEALAKAMKYA